MLATIARMFRLGFRQAVVLPGISGLLCPLFLVATICVGAAPASGQTAIATNAPAGQPLSVRVVAYTIDAKINTDKKTVEATESLDYKNLTGQPLDTFPFHLYLNAFRPQSTFAYETHLEGGIRGSAHDYPKDEIGGITIEQISADGYGDLTQQMQFTAPDDGNRNDHTVMQIHLAKPLAPGDTIHFHLKFHDKFPLSVARNGYKRDFLMGGQWFPKVGVFWHGAWNCHQYHATTEFFADFGTFDVKLTVPNRYIVGTSGVQIGEQNNGNGTKTLHFYGEDIHDFAWAASPHFQVYNVTLTNAMGTVRLHGLVLKEHANQAHRYMSVLKRTMDYFDKWYGPYPYKQITLIDPEPGSQMWGMEYPTLFTAGTSWWEPQSAPIGLETTTEHEYGHQYWYGMVATNEFEEAWLDEGINSYTEAKVMAALFGKKTSAINLPFAAMSDLETQRLGYLSMPDYDPMTRWAWKFYNAQSYGAITYGKTATVLTTLEAIVGEPTMQKALRVYFDRYKFKHPTGTDFLNTIQEVSGRTDLQPYFQAAVYGTQILDYEVVDAASEPAQWWKSSPKHYKGPWRTVVAVHRKGDFVFPVTLEVRFSDGSKTREQWDGVDRWIRYTYIKNAKVVSAEIDPDHQILLDKNFFNNSYRVAGNGTASWKLTNYLMFVEQCMTQLGSWFV
ncbi:MAG: M1 family metallopeptidase [Acidobacteriaceae bacterium]